MNEKNETLASKAADPPGAIPANEPTLPKAWILAAIGLTLGFGLPLFDLIRFSIGSDLYSHIGLVPLVSAYLVWMERKTLPRHSAPDPRLAILPLAGGIAALAGFWYAARTGVSLAREDSLALTTLSYVLLFIGVCGLFIGRATLRAIAFPLCFLIFMVPMPIFLLNRIETALQHGSASVAYAMFDFSSTPVFRQGLLFELPNIKLQVAPECSGIHSSLALFITSLVAGRLFLRSPWKRLILALAVIPLALVRNGFRVFTIGELCARIGPDMINSYIHHHGGPIFFALSLVPLLLLLFLLIRSDRPVQSASARPSSL